MPRSHPRGAQARKGASNNALMMNIFFLVVIVCFLWMRLGRLDALVKSDALYVSPNDPKDVQKTPPTAVLPQKHSLRKKNPPTYLEIVANQLSMVHIPNKNITATTIVTGGGACQCELISVDCLDSIRCLVKGQDSRDTIALGVWVRKMIKLTSYFVHPDDPLAMSPLGKSTQYTTITSWQSWTKDKILPTEFDHGMNLFINETWYPYCKERELVGKPCFFHPLKMSEDTDLMEKDALAAFEVSDEMQKTLREDIVRYRLMNIRRRYDLPALGHLMTMAHILRMRFNRRPPVREAFERHLESYGSVDENKNVLRVSVHLRRADACNHEREGFKTEASPLDSPAQTHNRACYETGVYMKALHRVSEMTDRPIEVYLSTDDAGSVLEQIKSEFKSIYDKMAWKVLNYSRDIFNYGVMVEDPTHSNHGLLGESAVADLWLLSHGEVFIGHLGSRFGKIGWLMATARYNRFIPFFSVDGHSYCCEIDEACGEMKKYIRSMENCMTYNHELGEREVNEDYWEVGSLLRKIEVEEEDRILSGH